MRTALVLLLLVTLAVPAPADDRQDKVAAALAGDPAVFASPPRKDDRARKVKAALALAGDPPAPVTGVEGFKWRTDYAAVAEAKAAGKPVFLMFTRKDCKLCATADATTFQDKEVRAILAKSVAVKIDVDAEPAVAKALGVTSLPTYLLVEKTGVIKEMIVGAQASETIKTHAAALVNR